MPVQFLLDTNTVSEVMADHPNVKAKLATQPGAISTCVIVQGEIRYGLERLPQGKRRTALEAKAATVLATLSIESVTGIAGPSEKADPVVQSRRQA